MSLNYSLIALPYPTELITHYAALADLPGFVLLESGDKTRGRYDIVSACPYQRFSCDDPREINQFIAQLEAALPTHDLSIDLPFQGGLLGYFTYDFGAHAAGVSVHSDTILGASSTDLADFGLYDWALIVDHSKQTITVFSANRHAETPAVIEDVLARWSTYSSQNPRSTQCTPFTPCIDRVGYQLGFQAVSDALYQGRCYQVNYTQGFLAEYEGDPWSLFEMIRMTNPVPFSAYFSGQFQTVVSFSPERFLLQDGDHLLASPIKGTARRHLDDLERDQRAAETLLHCEKNRAENTMIVDLWRHDLTKIAQSGTVNVSALCQLESYQSVHHLVSTIEGLRRSAVTPLRAFLSCFPAGSITGAPKLESMQVIYEQEPLARGVYCGSMAYFSAHGRSDSNITIRTLLAKNGRLSLSAGGGILIDSTCEDEYAECFIKIKSIQAALEK